MAFRATNLIPAEQYDRAKRQAIQVKSLAESRSASFATGATALEVLTLADNLVAMRDNLNGYKTTPGIAAYAEAQEDDPLYDVALEFNTMIAAIDAVLTEIGTSMPTDANDWALIVKVNADTTRTWRDFTGVQLATIIGLLDAVSASIS